MVPRGGPFIVENNFGTLITSHVIRGGHLIDVPLPEIWAVLMHFWKTIDLPM